jgi:vitamin B12 transporter
LAAANAMADDIPPAETIVVTASRVPQDIRTVGSSISVITADEIAKFQERFVLDALRTTPGLDAAQSGPPGGNASVFLRGSDSYQTMVLIDGVPVNDDSLPESLFDFDHLLTTDVQRIEVLRGPQSTMYGGDAIGGVINIITNRRSEGLAASGLVEGGSYGTSLVNGSVSGGIDNVSGYVNFTRYGTDGFPAANVLRGNHLPDGLQTTQVTAGGHAAASDWLSFDLALRSADSEAGYAGTDFTTNLPIDSPNEARTHERSGRLSATMSLFDGAFTGTASVMDSITRRHTLDFLYGETTYDGERRKADYVLSGKVVEWLRFVGGLSWQQDRAHTSYDDSRSTITRAVFAELQAEPVENLHLTAGGRVDGHSTFGDFGTYRLTAAYNIDATGTKLHAATGTGFRAPTLYELYDSFSGNPLLKPETSRSWEFGIDQEIEKIAVLKLTYFDQSINDRIDFNPVTFVSFNSGHTTAKGVELEADINPWPTVEVRGVYTYDLTEDLATGAQALRRPRHSGSLIAAWQATDALDLTLKLHIVGPRIDYGGVNLPGYATADLGAEYKITPHITVEGRIQNISDARYEEIYGYGTAGRSVYGGFAVKY